jgi:penicillin-binding protein 1A
MKQATEGDKPEWFTAPSNITTATVCRLSGKLATEGCDNVAVVDDNGGVETRSMAYTEYFVRGTEPTAYCDIHTVHGVFGKLAALIGGERKPTPPRLEDTGLAPAPATTAGAEPTSVPPPAETAPKKKRGFWSRLFGIGHDDEDKDKDKDRNGKDLNKDRQQDRRPGDDHRP